MAVTVLLLLEKGSIEEKELELTNPQSKKKATQLFKTPFCKKLLKRKPKSSPELFIHNSIIYNSENLVYGGFLQTKEIQFKQNTHSLLLEKKNPFYGNAFIYKTDSDDKLVSFTLQEYEDLYKKILDGYELQETKVNESESEHESENESIGSDFEMEDELENENSFESEVESENEMGEVLDYGDEEGMLEEDGENIVEDEFDTTQDVIDIEECEEEVQDELLDMDKHIIEETEESKNLRLQCKKILHTILQKDDLVNDLEEAILLYTIEKCKEKRVQRKWSNVIFKKIYVNKVRSIYTNLDSNSYVKNTNFLEKIKNGSIQITQLPTMTFQEIFPEHWKKLIDEKYKKEKILYEEKQEAMTDQYKCGRCKSRKCTYYELQTRSADESMTIFITCINCGNRWKQ